MIPVVLIAGAFFVHDQVTQKQQKKTSSITQDVVAVPSSPNSVKASTNPGLSESDLIDGELVHTEPTPDTELSWLDRPIRGALLKSLKRADLIRSHGEVERVNAIPPSSQIDLLGAQHGEGDPISFVSKGVLSQALLSHQGQALSRGLFIANDTPLSLSGIDLFGNQLTGVDRLDPKLIKAEFREAIFSNDSQLGNSMPSVNLLGVGSKSAVQLDIDALDFSQSNVFSEAPTSSDESMSNSGR